MSLARMFLAGLLVAGGIILGTFTVLGYLDPNWQHRQQPQVAAPTQKTIAPAPHVSAQHEPTVASATASQAKPRQAARSDAAPSAAVPPPAARTDPKPGVAAKPVAKAPSPKKKVADKPADKGKPPQQAAFWTKLFGSN